MAKKTAKTETQNAMDYPEHEKTYLDFLWLTKWGTIFCVVLLIAMAGGFFGGLGGIGGTLAFFVMLIIAFFIF